MQESQDATPPPLAPSTNGAPQSTEVAAISLSLRLPPFWRDKPRLWFISFEAATHDLKKSQKQLAQMVIAQLDKQDVEQICDLLFDPPDSANQYTSLKERLISVYEESEERQIQKLFSEMELGDQRPSQLLRRMRNLARNNVPDSTLRHMWMNLLPRHVRSVLVVSDTISKQIALDEIALLADKMMEQNADIHAVSPLPTTSTPVPERRADMQYLLDEMRKLTLEVAELRTNYNRRQPRTSRSRSRSSFRSRTQYDSSYCYYHRRFKHNARRCESPCNFEKDNKKEN